jgi:nucleoside-diphosphate-sugar epimerase
MKLFVTGATGFLGSHFLRVALQAGHEVTALRRSATSKPRLALPFMLQWLEKGLSEVTADDLIGHDVVVHLAAAGVKASTRSWPEALEANVLGTISLYESARRCPGGPPAFVMTRTFYEDLVAQEPRLNENPYIATKRVASEAVRLSSGDYKAPVVLVRVFQVYGPLDEPTNVLSYAAAQFAHREKAHFGSGCGRRDWIRVRDAAAGLLATVSSVQGMPPAIVQDIDLGSGQLRSIREMVEMLASIAGLDADVACEFDPARDRPDVGVELAALKSLHTDAHSAEPEAGLKELWQSTLDQLGKS